MVADLLSDMDMARVIEILTNEAQTYNVPVLDYAPIVNEAVALLPEFVPGFIGTTLGFGISVASMAVGVFLLFNDAALRLETAESRQVAHAQRLGVRLGAPRTGSYDHRR